MAKYRITTNKISYRIHMEGVINSNIIMLLRTNHATMLHVISQLRSEHLKVRYQIPKRNIKPTHTHVERKIYIYPVH